MATEAGAQVSTEHSPGAQMTRTSLAWPHLADEGHKSDQVSWEEWSLEDVAGSKVILSC